MTTTKDKIEKEDRIAKENYERFSIFWEKARNIKDEEGDNILTWDKSIIAQFCFNQGYLQAQNEFKEKIEKILKEIGEKFIYHSDIDGVDLKLNDLEEYKDYKDKIMEIKQ